MTKKEWILRTPDDWHIHLRDGDYLPRTVADTARVFARGIVMPNTVPPILTAEDAGHYRHRIEEHIPEGIHYTPLMTLYLTDNTTPEIIREAVDSGIVYGCKLYPAGATTNSDSGVTDLTKLSHTLEEMEKLGMPLLLHGEVTDSTVDIFDRETEFLEKTLQKLVEEFPGLKMVLEHITTKAAVDFVSSAPPNLAATITAHHLMFQRNDMLAGRIRPHYYCLPILKRERDRQALIQAAIGDTGKFFAGTDSAPHERGQKESACGCAGSYTALQALEMYAQIFDEADQMERLERFVSEHGSRFYGLPLNEGHVRLVKEPFKVPRSLSYGGGSVIPLCAGTTLAWKAGRM